ncbi:MAG: putative bifunctional diguanylate cyclase/phosphodiesterase [Acidimicrobiales bacterium]
MAVDGAAGTQHTDRARLWDLGRDLGGERYPSRQLYELAFANSPTAMAVVSETGDVLEVNAAFCELVGHGRAALVGPAGAGILRVDGVEAGGATVLDSCVANLGRRSVRWRRGDGSIVGAEVTTGRFELPGARGACCVIAARDVASEDELVAQLTFQAFHDPLTGLANRVLFEDRLGHALARAARAGGGCGAVFLLDLDDFKGVNDTLGHHVGDELLVALADRLRVQTRASDTLCRFGGDEFLLLVEDLDGAVEVNQVAARLMRSFDEPFAVGGTSVIQQASLGIVPWATGDEDPTSLFARADTAMYEAKRLGKGRHVVFDPGVHERAVQRFELAQELRGALAADELSMHFQPLVDLATGKVEGFEALMRWAHPTRASVPPTVFVALAEESDLIFDLGAFALREATRRAMSWTALDSDRSLYVSVNLSTRQLYDPNLVRVVEEALTLSGLPPSRLVLEVTESAALGDLEAANQTMQRLVHLGIRMAIDDFGIGYSSLSYLSLIYPKIIKIDHSLVRGCDDDPDRLTLLEGVVSLGHGLGAKVVAEGVETAEHLACLRMVGCDVGQGYLFSPAVAAGEVVATMRRIEEARRIEKRHRVEEAGAAGWPSAGEEARPADDLDTAAPIGRTGRGGH